MTNTFCWVDLATPDVGAARAFYGALWDWSSQEQVGVTGRPYQILSHAERRVAGMFEMDEDMRSQVPPHWTGYVQVEDIEACVARSQRLGASVCMPVVDAGGAGRMAILIDPTGASFALWQVLDASDPPLRDALHASCWQELFSPDPGRAQVFYSQCFGWTAHPDQSGPTAYTTFQREGQPVAGMRAGPPGVPAHWRTFFSVADCDGAVARAISLGGQLRAGPTNHGQAWRFAELEDPQGAAFCVLEKVS